MALRLSCDGPARGGAFSGLRQTHLNLGSVLHRPVATRQEPAALRPGNVEERARVHEPIATLERARQVFLAVVRRAVLSVYPAFDYGPARSAGLCPSSRPPPCVAATRTPHVLHVHSSPDRPQQLCLSSFDPLQSVLGEPQPRSKAMRNYGSARSSVALRIGVLQTYIPTRI